jgi:hypothetical protein
MNQILDNLERRLTTDEFFPIGSNTKVYTSIGVLMLAEKFENVGLFSNLS